MAERVTRIVGGAFRHRLRTGTGLAALAAAKLFGAVPAAAPAAGTRTTAAKAPKTRTAKNRTARRRRPHADSPQYINAHVNALIQRMTVAEKFGQLEMSGPQGPNGTPGQALLDEVKAGTVSSVLDMVGVDNINTLQQAALQSRLHIPIIASLDVIHGYKTMFPVPLAESATWDPSLVANDESVSALRGDRRWPEVDVQPDGRHQP